MKLHFSLKHHGLSDFQFSYNPLPLKVAPNSFISAIIAHTPPKWDDRRIADIPTLPELYLAIYS